MSWSGGGPAGVGLPGVGCRALCEDWRADIGNGHYGGLRIRPPTWAQSGVRHFADRGAGVSPSSAPRLRSLTGGS
ncbi:MAG TPA: transglycosylase family protein [Kitasatospora aureofaciens]|nr:transglycosylase family protein [Kitasatospora aureofaciens]HJD81100.1 transglycosylase family protein [Kitasatospora aureofaciens]